MKILSSFRGQGGSVYEDGLKFKLSSSGCIIGIFDGRGAWQESGNQGHLKELLKAESTGQAAAKFAVQVLNGFGIDMDVRDLTVQINQDWGLELEKCDYNLSDSGGLPGCAATIATINTESRMLQFAHLLDTKIILFNKDGDFFIPTIDYMDKFDRIVLRLAVENAKKLGVNPMRALYEVDYTKHPILTDPKVLDTTHRKLENTSLKSGLGVLNGMGSMENFLQIGQVPLGNFQYIWIFTDGMTFPSGIDDSLPWHKMIQYLLNNNLDLEKFVKEIRRREKEDMEDFWKYPRFAFHRDATGVLIKV